jgi:hypothetical protein
MCGSNNIRVLTYMNLAEVICSDCGLKMWGLTTSDAIRKWNRRAPESKITREQIDLERLRKLLTEYESREGVDKGWEACIRSVVHLVEKELISV